MPMLMVAIILLSGGLAMAQEAFTNHGVAAPIAELRAGAACQDAQGRSLVILVPLDQSDRGYLLVVDVDSGKTEQYAYPDPVPFAGAFASLLSRNGKFYTGEGGYLMEFDPSARKFTFHGMPHPGCQHFVGQALIDGPGDLIWIGTYPLSHLVSYNPQTHEFKDYGQLDPAEHYFNTLAYDDAGWFYAGIGTARMSLVAFNPQTGEKKQLLSEAQRVVGTATVYTATDGKAYGSAGKEWYRLHQGQATPIKQAEAGPRAPSGTMGYGGRVTAFPDGRQFRALSLEDRWLEVHDPKADVTRRVALDYKSGGSYLTSMVLGPDGRIYTSSSHPMHFSFYDPQTGKMTDLGGVKDVGGGNFCAMAVQGKYVVAPSYSSGIFHVFDTTRPFNGGQGEDPNPAEVARWSEDICRPRAALAHPDGKTVFMAGYAGYGRVGGGLGIYDLETRKATLIRHEQLIPNQSTIALAVLPDGHLLGGTTIGAPGGGHVQAQEGVLYVYDWRAGTVLFQTTPVPGADSIVSLALGSEGLVYGLASGAKLFVFDLQKRQVVHTADLGVYGSCPRANLARLPDGSLVAVMEKAVLKITPQTFEVTSLAATPVPVTAALALHGGRLYFASKASVWSYRLP